LIGQAEETASLDFKKELSKNPELAKDVAAMTVNGGVLIYGVEEDQKTRIAMAIHKFALGGIEERIRQTIGSRVAPVPEIDVLPVTEKAGDRDGVVVLVVPPSSLVPHQANYRYPRRSGTTTDYLEEPEVARLYEQRRELAGSAKDVGELLDLHAFPRSAGGDGPGSMFVGMARLRLVVKPKSQTTTHPASPWLYDALQRAYHGTLETLLPRIEWERRPEWLTVLDGWEPYGAIGWTVGASGGSSAITLSRKTEAAVLSYPATLSFQATWPLDVGGQGGAPEYRCAYEPEVALAVIIFLAFSGQFLGQMDGVGPVECAAEFAGFEGTVSFRATQARPGLATEGMPRAHDVSEATIASVTELQDEPESVAQRLIDRWLVPFYQGDPLFPHLVRSAEDR
jgi:hypothetical protein